MCNECRKSHAKFGGDARCCFYAIWKKKTQMRADIRPRSVHGFKLVFERKIGAYLISFLLFWVLWCYFYSSSWSTTSSEMDSKMLDAILIVFFLDYLGIKYHGIFSKFGMSVSFLCTRSGRLHGMYRELQLLLYTLVFSTYCPPWHGQHCVRDQKYMQRRQFKCLHLTCRYSGWSYFYGLYRLKPILNAI